MTPLVVPPADRTSARKYVRTIGSVLPVIEPAPLASLKLPIDHPNWLFELKHDGFRGTLYVDRDRGWLRSRDRDPGSGISSGLGAGFGCWRD